MNVPVFVLLMRQPNPILTTNKTKEYHVTPAVPENSDTNTWRFGITTLTVSFLTA